MCYEESGTDFLPPETGRPFEEEEGPTGEDRHGAVCDGGGLFYAPQIEAGGSDSLLSVGLDPGGEPAPLYSKGGGRILAPASFFLEGVHQGDGFLGEGEQGDRAAVKGDRQSSL